MPNQLLGSGVQLELEYDPPPVNKRTPAWRFHKDFPDKLCKTDAELDKADAEGWVDHPGKARRLPGHEKMLNQLRLLLKRNLEIKSRQMS
jgi:hypothetical protein